MLDLKKCRSEKKFTTLKKCWIWKIVGLGKNGGEVCPGGGELMSGGNF
jgi:hypothetical protein